ncbi:CHC2 zinc finger domain-containing protein [Neobacillus drentensis]|uniref:CHC2 zinc finger domain-containing protein n=1 Tax=Neobacillus drentensis TaxID=220684 RepID=UPI003000B845
MSTVDEIKERFSIIEAIETYTNVDLSKLKTTKKQFNICCPWHNDKTPSLTIYTKSNTWKCQAGCGGGDVINLVSKALSISNREAILMLQKQLGIKNKVAAFEYSHWQNDRKIFRGFEETKDQIVSKLLHHRNLFNQAMKQVVSLEDRDRLVEVYHFKALIEKYLEELDCTDFDIQVATVKYLKPLFLEVIS